MAKVYKAIVQREPGRKASSTGVGGRGRRVKISTSTMNKHKKRLTKRYKGQGR